MNFLIPHSWLKEFLPALPKPETTARQLSLAGPSIDRVITEGTDTIYDAEITTNRADLWSLVGSAREAAAILALPWKEPFLSVSLKKRLTVLKGRTAKPLLSVRIEDPDLCPRYAGMMLDHVVVRESPQWMKARLLACGQRPINAVVDITNYVMLEYGQPMHAFDASKVVTNTKLGDTEEERREIVVRRATEKEKFVTLDGDEKILDSSMLVIADHAGPLALAGIKGGDRARVDENTHTIILESASFNPVSVRKTSRAVDIRTDSSSRFEKGLSAELPLFALVRAAELLIEICDARV
ncbi:MAG: phenylalanine--tRNA ligase beta subunit-related protein, partial [Patescibacteria group bacterium]